MAEYFDIVDEKGVPTGEVKARSEVHTDGDWHRVINLWLVNSKDEVLVQKRAMGKKKLPGFWDLSVGGHLGVGDTWEEALVREVGEELGVGIDLEEVECMGERKSEYRDEAMWDREVMRVYVARVDFALEDFTLQEEELSEVRWVSVEKLEDLIKSGRFVPHKDMDEIVGYLRSR